MSSEIIDPETFFVCTQCGECCKGYGGTYVSDNDIAAIAAFLSREPSQIRAAFCNPSGRRWVLAQRADGYCVFWDGNCTIHPVKPLMCRQWPFIPGLRADPANWHIMAGMCPGMKRDIHIDQLLSLLDRMDVK